MKMPPAFVVICTKSTGVDIVFAGGLDAAAAHLLAARLVDIGCMARSEPMRPNDIPGLQRRPR
jgi:hypothetical protein